MEASKVEELVLKVGDDNGYDVIQVKVDHTRNVRVWVDHPLGVTSEGTRSLSKAICFALDDAGTDPGNYRFEVQSPGVDRLLARPKDYERFKGNDVTVRMHKGQEPNLYTGLLKGWIDDKIVIVVGDETKALDPGFVREVRLVPVLPFLSEGEQNARRNARRKGKGKGKSKGKRKRKR